MCNERYKWLGWVGLGGGPKVLLACSNANKTRKTPEPRKKIIDRQQNNAVITVVTRTKIREKKKRKGTGTGSDVSVPRVVKLLLLLGRPPTTTIYGR